MNNYKLVLQYEGTQYAGWQIQENAVTVQKVVTDAIQILVKEAVKLNGSGRTDSGVHALGQAANFRINAELDLYKFKYQLNSILPGDISVRDVFKADENFHARYDAKKRTYLYIISRFKSPFLKNYSWYLNRELDIKKMNYLAMEFLGQKDYTSFCRKASETENKICHVYKIAWKEKGGLIVFMIEADRFLHGMVRTILGTFLEAVKRDIPEKYIADVISSRERSNAGEAVPAKGLFLYKVQYENKS